MSARSPFLSIKHELATDLIRHLVDRSSAKSYLHGLDALKSLFFFTLTKAALKVHKLPASFHSRTQPDSKVSLSPATPVLLPSAKLTHSDIITSDCSPVLRHQPWMDRIEVPEAPYVCF